MDCRELFDVLNNWKGDVCIFGAGNHGKSWLYRFLSEAGYNILFYIDNYKVGQTCNGLPVYSIEKLSERTDIYVFVSVYGSSGEDIVSQLKERGIEHVFHINSEYAPIDIYRFLIREGNECLFRQYKSISDDKEYLKIRYKYRTDKELDLDNPKTFNEKLNWLKLYDRNPQYTAMVDKYEVREIVTEKIGEKYVVPILGVWDDFDSINFEKLPDQFVLKCTHDSGSVIICRNKKEFDLNGAKNKIEKALSINPFCADREWPYLDVKPRVIAEQLLSSGSYNLEVFKIFNLNGVPRIIQVIQDDKTTEETIDYFDVEWNLLNLRQNYPNSIKHMEKPVCLSEMLDLSRKLSEGIPFVRTDFYVIGEKILFSEYTFYSDSGSERFHPDKWDVILGDMLKLPEEKRENN